MKRMLAAPGFAVLVPPTTDQHMAESLTHARTLVRRAGVAISGAMPGR
jgi:hypothetical protein